MMHNRLFRQFKYFPLLLSFLYLNICHAQIITDEVTVTESTNTTLQSNGVDKLEVNDAGVTILGDEIVNGEINATSVSSDGAIFLNNGGQIKGLRGYTGANNSVTIDLESSSTSFHAQVTLSGLQGNTKNHRFLWHGVITWDKNYSQKNVFELNVENTTMSVYESGGFIKLNITGSGPYPLYVVYKGVALINKGG